MRGGAAKGNGKLEPLEHRQDKVEEGCIFKRELTRYPVLEAIVIGEMRLNAGEFPVTPLKGRNGLF